MQAKQYSREKVRGTWQPNKETISDYLQVPSLRFDGRHKVLSFHLVMRYNGTRDRLCCCPVKWARKSHVLGLLVSLSAYAARYLITNHLSIMFADFSSTPCTVLHPTSLCFARNHSGIASMPVLEPRELEDDDLSCNTWVVIDRNAFNQSSCSTIGLLLCLSLMVSPTV